MKTAVPFRFDYLIIAGGEAPPTPMVKRLRRLCRSLVSVDSGADAALKAGFVPDLHVGDNDSANAASLKKIPRERQRVLPRRKSISDLEYAVQCLPTRASKVIIGAHRDVHGRSDHVLVNFLLASRHPNTFLVDPRMWIYNVSRQDFRFRVPRGTTFSVLTFDLKPVTISGSAYDIREKKMARPSMGLSNRAVKGLIRVRARGSALLFVESRFAPGPKRP